MNIQEDFCFTEKKKKKTLKSMTVQDGEEMNL